MANVVNVVCDIIEIWDSLTCAACCKWSFSLSRILVYSEIQEICQKDGKFVRHFCHSNTAAIALQAQLNTKSLKLIQSIKTRWNSTFEMSETYYKPFAHIKCFGW